MKLKKCISGKQLYYICKARTSLKGYLKTMRRSRHTVWEHVSLVDTEFQPHSILCGFQHHRVFWAIYLEAFDRFKMSPTPIICPPTSLIFALKSVTLVIFVKDRCPWIQSPELQALQWQHLTSWIFLSMHPQIFIGKVQGKVDNACVLFQHWRLSELVLKSFVKVMAINYNSLCKICYKVHCGNCGKIYSIKCHNIFHPQAIENIFSIMYNGNAEPTLPSFTLG